jgi:hypothetical protein
MTKPVCSIVLKTLIIATVLLPTLTIAQRSQQLPPAEMAGPIVPGGLDGERQLLRTWLRQGAGRYSQERLVSGPLARERQLLHRLRVRAYEHPVIGSDEQMFGAE